MSDLAHTKVIVARNYLVAQNFMKENNLDPRKIKIVTDIEGAKRLEKLTLKETEIVWLSEPHSYPKIITRLIQSRIQ